MSIPTGKSFAIERARKYEYLLSQGVSPKEAVEKIGGTAANMARYYYRHGRSDLAAALQAVHRHVGNNGGNPSTYQKKKFDDEGRPL